MWLQQHYLLTEACRARADGEAFLQASLFLTWGKKEEHNTEVQPCPVCCCLRHHTASLPQFPLLGIQGHSDHKLLPHQAVRSPKHNSQALSVLCITQVSFQPEELQGKQEPSSRLVSIPSPSSFQASCTGNRLLPRPKQMWLPSAQPQDPPLHQCEHWVPWGPSMACRPKQS